MAQQSIEERLASLEHQIAELQAERAQMRELGALRTDVKALSLRYQAHEEYVSDRLNDFEDHIKVRIDVVEDNLTARLDAHTIAIQVLQEGQQEHKAAIENLAGSVRGLAVGQQQILDLLTGGKPKGHD